jgi:hypothetical protein
MNRDDEESQRFFASLRMTTSIANQSVSSLTKPLDHVSAFQTIAKRAIIFPGADTTKHR